MVTRTLTALVAIPIAFFLIKAGGWPFLVALTFLSAVGWFELSQMAQGSDFNMYYLTSGIPTLILVGTAGKSAELTLGILALSCLAVMMETLFFYHRARWPQQTCMNVFALVYIGVLFSHLMLLREFSNVAVAFPVLGSIPYGEALLWLALLGTWASDTFAYLIGCSFGRNKLLPAVSPKKSVEGAVAGFVGSFIVIMYLGFCCLNIPFFTSIGLALLVAFVAPIGDLVESQMKRYFRVKDSGFIFPGHGGVLDRLDSLLFVIPVVYYYVKYIVF